jgi:hypothetical protein
LRFTVLVLIAALLAPQPSRADCNDRPEQWSFDAAKPWRYPHRWILWSAGMELGDLSEWSQKVNTDAADSWAVTAVSEGIPPQGGKWVLKQSVTGSVGGTRMARYPEIAALAKAGTPFFVSWWDYYPARISFGPADSFSIFYINSTDSAGAQNPVWGLVFDPNSFALQLLWSPNATAPAEGPHAAESGKRAYGSTCPVPIGRWVLFEVMIRPAADFTGALKVWMNGEVLFDLEQVKTRFPDSKLGGLMWLNHDAYGSGLTPTPATHYIDDVAISLRRLRHGRGWPERDEEAEDD